MLAIVKAALVILAGVYAMRMSWFLFEGRFDPLTPVAALAFLFSIAVFFRPPLAIGPWLWVVLACCALGLVANTLLFLYPDKAHASVTNLTFSAVSVAGWAIIGFFYGWSALARPAV